MAKMKGAIVVNTDRCKGCSECVVACPVGAIELAHMKINVHGYQYAQPSLDADRCT